MFAASYYWDNDGTTAGFGTAAGTWAAPAIGDATQGWSEDSAGTTEPVSVTTSTSDTVFFGTSTGLGSGTVTVSGTVAANKAVFGSATGPITLSGGTVALGGTAPSITLNNEGNTISSALTLNANASVIMATTAALALDLNGAIGGTGNLTFTTSSINLLNVNQVITLGAASSYTGTTLITTANINSRLTVKLNTTNALPSTTVLTLDGGNGTGSGLGRSLFLEMNGKNQTIAGLANVTRTLRYQRITNSTGTPTLTIDNTADYSFSGSIFGTGISLLKAGSGTQTLAGANAYTGSTLINGGELRLGEGGTGGALSTSSDIVVASGATFGVNQSDAVVQGTDFSGNPISGDGNFAKLGSGSTTLNVANSYNGTTTVNGGALVVAHASALGTTAAGTVVNGSATGSSANARLDLSGGVTVTGESLTISGAGSFFGALTSSSGSNVWAGPVTIGATGTRLGAAAAASLEVSGVIDSGAVNTGLVIRATDLTSTVILSGANTYLGTTQVIIGKLQLNGGDNRLPTGNILTLGSSGTNADAEFDLNGRNQEVAGLNLTGSGTPAKNSVNNSSGTLSTLTVNTPAATPSTFEGILKGNLAITKAGPDTLSLTGTSNVYTGDTTVNEGTLSLGGINPSNESSTVTIASGATLDLTFTGTDTVDKLFIGTTQMAAGVYGPSATSIPQIINSIGTGTLTVTTGPAAGGFTAWQSANSTAGGLDQDHDGDGVSNGVEYFIYGPVANSGPPPCPA